MIILVTGGRNFGNLRNHDNGPITDADLIRSRLAERTLLRQTLDDLHATHPISMVLQGGAKGADRCAQEWASQRGVKSKAYFAHWVRHGKAAGPMRNQLMLEEGRPDMVIAFAGGRGTADMVERTVSAQQRGVRVILRDLRP